VKEWWKRVEGGRDSGGEVKGVREWVEGVEVE
jgi:hypothetical protein